MELHRVLSPGLAWVSAVPGLLLALSLPSTANELSARTVVGGQFSMVLPQGWNVYDQVAAVSGRAGPTGVVIFSAEPLTLSGMVTADVAALARVDSGEMPSFIVDRRLAERGMLCQKLSRTAVYNIGEKLKQDPVFSATRRHFAVLSPRHDDIELGGCRGVKFLLEANKGDAGKHWIIDVRAVSDGQVLYLFGLRNRAEHYANSLGAFEDALATLRFP